MFVSVLPGGEALGDEIGLIRLLELDGRPDPSVVIPSIHLPWPPAERVPKGLLHVEDVILGWGHRRATGAEEEQQRSRKGGEARVGRWREMQGDVGR